MGGGVQGEGRDTCKCASKGKYHSINAPPLVDQGSKGEILTSIRRDMCRYAQTR